MDAEPKVEAFEEFVGWKDEPKPLEIKPMEDQSSELAEEPIPAEKTQFAEISEEPLSIEQPKAKEWRYDYNDCPRNDANQLEQCLKEPSLLALPVYRAKKPIRKSINTFKEEYLKYESAVSKQH